MNKKEILKKLEDDEHYYGSFGKISLVIGAFKRFLKVKHSKSL